MRSIKAILVAATVLSAVAFMSFTTTEASSVETNMKSKLTWLKDTHDFGEIRQGKPVTVEFRFRNDGAEPILVADVVTSCGCTASDYSKQPIAPGKTSTIKATYNAAATGVFAKTITVNFSDPSANKVLNIKGTVK